MGERRIEAALRQATDTQNVNIAAGASVPGVFREGFSDSPAVVVADENTFEVAGKEVRRRLERAEAFAGADVIMSGVNSFGVRCGQELLRSRCRLHGGHTRP